MTVPKYKRVLLKLGGEALAGPGGYGISPHMAEEVAAKFYARLFALDPSLRPFNR